MLEIGKIYRVTQKPNFTDKILDGYPNLYYETNVDNKKSYVPRQGITKFAKVKDPNGNYRRPLYILLSENNKSGKNYNPWHDELHSDRGIVTYYGDNKPEAKKPEYELLLEQQFINNMHDKEQRINSSVPILCFSQDETGYDIFQGFGIIEAAELVTQYSDKYNTYFSNYLFTICIFSMATEDEKFNWDWIRDRCNPSLTNKEANRNAPESWKRWINEGISKIHLIRRNVYSSKIIDQEKQRPEKGSDTAKILESIYNHYSHSTQTKLDFEALAIEVTKKVIEENGGNCTPGWITQSSNDGGFDFVLKLNVGVEKLSGLQVIVLGQAKCETLDGHVNGKDIARLVARLKRGWVGAFVTTQPFSNNVQKEVLQDNYPVLLINGKKVAEIVQREFRESIYSNIDDYLDSITNTYKRSNRIPEDLLE